MPDSSAEPGAAQSGDVRKPYLSPSSIGQYLRCGHQRYLRLTLGSRPPGMALLKGSGLDGGATLNMKQKVESHEDLPESDIVDAAVATFDQKITVDGYELDPDEKARGAAVVIGDSRDSVAKMAKVHAEEQAPEYQPVLVQKCVELELPGTHNLLGYMDMADDKHRVVDWKTSKRKKPESEAHDSMQLTAYAAMYRAETGHNPSALILDTLVQTPSKRNTYRQPLETTRDEGDFEAFANVINAVSDAHNAGVFPPTGLGTWMCSPKWCGYWSDCIYVKRSSAPTVVELDTTKPGDNHEHGAAVNGD